MELPDVIPVVTADDRETLALALEDMIPFLEKLTKLVGKPLPYHRTILMTAAHEIRTKHTSVA